MSRILIALCVAGLVATMASAGQPVTMPVLRTDKTVLDQPVAIPPQPTVLVTTMRFAPGARTAVHKHPWAHYAYVLEGTLTIHNVEAGTSFDLPAGRFLVEMQDTWHWGENKGTAPVRLLVVDQLPAGVAVNSVARDER